VISSSNQILGELPGTNGPEAREGDPSAPKRNDKLYLNQTELDAVRFSARSFLVAAISAFVPAIALSGCGSLWGVSSNITSRSSQAVAATAFTSMLPTASTWPADYTTLYSFAGGSDGAYPLAGLANGDGTFFGTTFGGGGRSGCDIGDCGTAFKISPVGQETILYRFGAGKDGSNPATRLLYVDGDLYGSTQLGGTGCISGCGTVFKIKAASGRETVVYRFKGAGMRQAAPSPSGLIVVDGNLYGTTFYGGTGCVDDYCGTVFEISSSGRESVVHAFKGRPTDGSQPSAGVINVAGSLYGTTSTGGAYGFGTVFRIGSDGKEKVLYSFSGGSDGKDPEGGLIDVGGVLYGTTQSGGSDGDGTVYEVDQSGHETVLHQFGGVRDGSLPRAGLINVGGMLFGTRAFGGAYGQGVVYQISRSGQETVLYDLMGNYYAYQTHVGLANIGRTLFGTTSSGGANYCFRGQGCGTVFSIAL